MKKILVLGATGFIGRNVVEYFAKIPEFEVYGSYFKSPVLDYDGVKMINADLTNKKDVDQIMKGMDIVIQAAAVTSGIKDVADNPHAFISDNAVMNSLILRSAFDHSIDHLILLSCSVMYRSSNIPLKENDFDATQEMYPNYFGGGWNKVYFEKMCEFYSRLGSVKYTAIRHSNVYGPYDKYDLQRAHAFGATITKVMTEKSNKLVIWGDGEEKRDFIYVLDLVKAFEAIIDKQNKPFKLYNIGSGHPVKIKDLVKKIINVSGKSFDIIHDLSKPSNKVSFSLNSNKAKQELGWQMKISLDEGIQKTIRWYKNNKYF